jgi:ABC-type glutathione transport system ATPase component
MMNGNGAALIDIAGVAVHFATRRSWIDAVSRTPRQVVRAVDGVDLAIGERETLGLVGESGSGKTTLARTLVRIYEPTGGEIKLKGRALADYPRLGDDGLCRQIQMVFQDPYSSLNPRKTVGAALTEVLLFHRLCAAADAPSEVVRLLREVGLPDSVAGRLPRTLSGGQRQRVGLMRALMLDPPVLLLDEPLAALDPLTRAELQGQLLRIFRELGKTVVLVTHDVREAFVFGAVITLLSAGRVVQQGTFADLAQRPAEPLVAQFLRAQAPPPAMSAYL